MSVSKNVRAGLNEFINKDREDDREKSRSKRDTTRRMVSRAIGPVLEVLEVRQLLSLAAGSPDTAFNSTGTLTTSVATGFDHGQSVAVQTNGIVVVGGSANGQFGLATYSPTGALLSTISTTIGSSSGSQINQIVIDPQGRVVVAGTAADPTTGNDLVVARYTVSTAGILSLDTSFGTGGYTTTDVGNARRSDVGTAVALQPMGGSYDILVAGTTVSSANIVHDEVARYTSAGILDTNFGASGFATTTGAADVANAIVVNSDGSFVLAGNTSSAGETVSASSTGTGLTRHALTLGSGPALNAITLTSTGEYLVAGTADSNFLVAEIQAGGATLDSSFGTGGKTETVFAGDGAQANDIAIQANGKIVVAGYETAASGNQEFAVARYNTNGSSDAYFGTAGTTTTDFTGGTGNNVAGGVAIQPDGKIVAAGNADVGTNPPAFAVASYVSDNAPTGTGLATLTTIDQNETTYSPTTVASLLAQLGAADVDGDTLGIAITGVDDSNGVFQYSTNGGTSYSAIPASSTAAAFLLGQMTAGSNNLIRFVPTSGFTGTSTLMLKVWDMTQGTAGSTYNTAASAASNLNAFSDATFTVTQTVSSLPSTVYVDYRWTGDTQGQTVTDTSGGTHTFGIDAFPDIQDGINYVASGGTVHVDSGQYNQSQITVPHAVTIVGQSESTVTVAPSVTGKNGFEIQSSNVTIEDLTVDGNANSSLSGTLNFVDGLQIDYTAGEFDNTVVNTVAFKNLYNDGAEIYDYNGSRVTSGNVVENSSFTDIGTSTSDGDNGYAIILVQSSGTITNNVISDVTNGIATNFSTQYPTYAPTINITQNNISGLIPDPTYGGSGLDLFGLALDSSVTGNTIDTTGDAGPGDYGVIFGYLSDVRGTSLQFTGNTIKSDGADTGLFIDHRSFGVSSTFTPVNAASNSFTYSGTLNTSSVGVLVSDNDGGSNDNSGGTVANSTITGYATGIDVSNVTAGDLTSATITGNTISGAAGGTAILVSGTGASANISGNSTVGGTATGIDLEGGTSTVTGNTFAGNGLDLKVTSAATLTALTTNAFTGSQFIDNLSAQNIDATTDTFNVGTAGAPVTGNSLTNAQAYAVEDKITDAIDQTGLGLVRIKTANIFVTPNSYTAPATTDTGAIQRGVNAASSGDTVNIQSGTYTDNVTISKPLTIDGANVGVAGASAARGAETIVTPAAVQTAIFTVSGTSNVKLDGLTIDGYNPTLTGGALYSGDTTDVSYAVHTAGTVSGLTVQNDVIKRVAIGVRGDGLSSGNLITANDFDSIGNFDFGYAVSLRTDFYADVTNNVMTRVWTGVHLNNFHNAGGPATFTISGNTIQDYAGGVMDWLQYGSATPLTLSNNQISVQSGEAPVANNFGLSIVSLQNTDSIAITNDTFTGEDDGVVIFNASTSNPVTLGSTDTISGSKLAAVYETDNLAVNPIGTTNFLASGPGAAQTADLTGAGITGATGVGVLVDSSGGTATGLVATGQSINGSSGTTGVEVSGALSTASLTATAISGFTTGVSVDNGTLTAGAGDTITGGTTSLVLNGSSAAVTGLSLNNLALNGPSGNYITLSSGAENGSTLNATNVSFDGHTGATATLAQDYAIEDKISDFIDAPGVGFVQIKTGNVYVTALSDATTNGSIERAVTFASSGDTIHVSAGSFVGDIDLVNPVTLQGAQVGVSPTGTAPATASQTMITSSQAQADDTANTIITVDASNVTIDGVTVDGSVPATDASTDSAYGSNVGSADAIGAYNVTSGLVIQNDIIQHTAYTGLDLDNYNSGGTPTSGNIVKGNLIQDEGVTTGDLAGYGVGIYVADNFYAAISGNVISNAFVGIQTGNFYQANPGAAASISGNTVTAGAVGIFYNLIYESASPIPVTNNVITAHTDPNGEPWTGVLVTSLDSGVNAAFRGNTIDGSAASDTTGQSSGYQFWNDPTTGTVNVSGGSVTGVDYGVWVNSYEGYASNGSSSAPTVSGLSITANKAGVYVEDSPQNGNHPAVSAAVTGSTITAPIGVLVSGSAASATVAGTTISDTTTGIEDDNGTLTVGTGDTINGGVTGLILNGSTAAVTGLTLNNLALNGPSGNYITLANAAEDGSEINATGVTFNTVVGGSATTTQAYAIEDKITDAIDENGVGFVRIKSGNVFVTPNSFVTPATDDTGAISRAVAVASDGDTVHIESGLYHETQVVIGKGLTLVGDSEAGVIIDGGGESVTIPNSSGVIHVSGTTVAQPVTIKDLTVQDEGNSGGFDSTSDIEATGVVGALTVENTTLFGEDDYSNIDTNLQIVNAGQVAVENNNFSNSSQGMLIEDALGAITVTQNTVTDLIATTDGTNVYSPEGILLLEDSGNVNSNSVQISNNTLTGFKGFGIIAQGGYTYAGAGGLGDLQIENNTVAVAGDDSDGILINNGAGNATDATAGGVTGATISGNTVTGDGTAGEDGIAVNGYNAEISIAGNTVTNTDIGIQLTGNSTVGLPSVTATGNVISNSATAGIEVDAGAATISGGSVTGSGTGLSVTGGTASVSGGSYTSDTVGLDATGGDLKASGATITGDTTGVFVSGGAVVDLGDTGSTNSTGLGSSTGGNTLSGYTGTGSNFAIDDQNTVLQPNVLAENDDFGKVSSSNQAFIGTVIHDHADDASLSTVEYTPAADATTQPTTVYVSGSFAGDKLGSDPDGSGPATSYGYDAFPDIADAIAAVATGGTVIVETGTYAGPVNITKNLTLEGNGSDPVIQATATMASQFTTSHANTAVVYIAPGVTATVQDLTVDGNGDGNNYGDGFDGVAFYNSAGTLNDVTVENVEQTPFNGVQGGVGVFADVTDGLARTVNVTDVTITNYQKNGTVFTGTGLTANMSGSTVTGAGTTGVIAQNGVEVAYGAVGNITGNTISGDSYNNNSVAVSTGVILYDGGAGTVVSGNTITASDVGVYAIGDAGNTTISNNNISGGAFDGIASDGNEVTITGNNLHNGSGDGIDLYDAENGSTVENNFIQNNAGDGIYIDGGVTDSASPLIVSGNDISGNSSAGLEDASTAVPVNADFNYWGSPSGPSATNNPNGTGNAVVIDDGAAGATFSPWYTSGTDSAPGTPGFQPTSAATFGIYGNSTATEGATYTINFTPSADITSYSVNYGDGSTVVYPAGTLSATHTFTEFGTYNVISTAVSTIGSVTSNTQVVVVGTATISATATNITATEGIAFNGSVGSFTDAAGASSNPADLSAVITWGDGATSTATLVETSPTSGVFTVDGTHTYSEFGNYTFSYTVTEAGSPAATFTSNTATATIGTATITPTATDITATEGIAFNGSVGSFTDAAGTSSNPADLSAVIHWGDGATSTATLVETTPTSGVFTVDGTHTYAEYGTDSIYFVVTEAGSPAATFTSNTATATVGTATITPTATNITATEGIAFNGSVGSFTDAAGASSNPADLSAVIYWGDGATSTATLVETTPTSGVFTVDGTHTYAEFGTDSIYFVVTEAGAPAATFTSNTATATVGTATITPTATNITATEGIAFNGSVGSFTDAAGASSNVSDLSAVITWGDGATSAATLVETTPTSGVFTVDGTHTYAEYGSYVLSYTVTEAGSPAATFNSNTATATIGTATITPTATNITATEGIAFNGSVGSFTDAAGASSNPADLSAVIHWGDGATSTATLVETTPTSGVFTVDGTHTYAGYGTDSIYFVVTEAGAPAATFTSNTATATIGTATITPTATDITATEGIAFNGSVGSFTDAAGASSNPADLSAVIHWGDGATSTATLVEITPTSGVFTVDGTHTYAEYGTDSIYFVVTEAGAPAATFTSNTATATVGTATITPTATNITATEGIAFNGSVGSFTDAAGASSNPADLSAVITWGDGATLTATLVETSPTSGIFTVDGTHTYSEYGNYTFSYTVTEAGSPAATFTSNTATATIGTATITPTATNITATEGIAFNGSVGSFTDAAGASSNPADLSAVIHWGDGATSTATLVETTPTSGVFTVDGTHTYAEYGTDSIYFVVTEAGAPAATFTSNTATATVGTATITPTATNITATEGIAFNGSVGSFTDAAGASSNPADLSAVITWGDGATSTATLVETSPTSGVFTVDGTHTYSEFGNYTFSYTVTEAGSPAATFTSNTATATIGTATITPTATDITATEGIAFNGSVGSFTDAAGTSSNPADLSAVIHWGDGATSTATLVETTPTSGVFTVDGTHTYAEYGTDSIYFVVTEAGSPAAMFTSNTATATVAASSYNVSAYNVSATEGTALSNTIFGQITDTAGSFTNPSDLVTTVSFGDGSTAAATLVATATPGVYSVEASHTYAEYGSYVTTISVVQAGGSTESAQAAATVSAASITLTAKNISGAEGSTLTNISVGTLVSGAGSYANPNDLSAIINWGDGTATTTATLVESISNPGTFDVEGTHTYGVYGTYTITIVAIEKPTTTQTATGTATIGEIAPTSLNLSASPSTINEDGSTTLSGSFTAPGTDTHTVTINYNDGSSPVTLSLGAGVTSFTNSHTYVNNISTNTTYTVSVTVTDSDNSSTSGSTSVTVDYVSPTVALSGSKTDPTNSTPNDAAGSTFTLTLAPVNDPGYAGGNRVQDYYINWGDGSATQVVPVSTISETSGGTVTHVYETGTVPQGTTTPNYTIHVDILDSNGYHTDAGTLGVVVYDVAPTASFSGSGSVSEGSAGNVLFFNQYDPSTTDSAAGYTYSYDFGNTGTFEISNSTSSSASVPASYLMTPGTFTVRGRITDQYGEFTDYTHTITITNVAPTVNTLSNVTVGEGVAFSELGSFSDPGNDAPWKVYANYSYNASSNPGTGTLIQSGSSKSFTLGYTYNTPGTYTVLVTVVDDQGATGTGSFTVTVGATNFAVTTFTPNPSGFDVTFNRALNTSALNLYSGLSGTYGSPDLTVTGPNGVVHGSFVYDPTTDTGDFIATNGILPAGSYSATLVGSTSAFQDNAGDALSSNDGTGNYDASFTETTPGDQVTVPNFARGPGQTVNLPATGTTGIPISISSGASVTAVDFTLLYNANDLTINSVSLPASLQADGFAYAINNNTPGDLQLSIYGTSSMPSGAQTLIYLNASVPSTAVYGNAAALQITGLRINEGNIAGTANQAVEKVAFIGDVSGNKGYSAYDSSLIANVVVHNASGFDAFPLIDPIIVGDVSGDGSLSGLDASMVAQESVGDSVPQIPAIPAGTVTTAPQTGLDPTVTLGSIPLANPGTTITIPVSISDTTGLLGANFSIGFNASQMQFVSASVGTADGNFTVYTNASNSAGTLQLGLSDNSTALSAGSGTIAYLTFTIPAAAPSGSNAVTLAGADGGLNEGGLALTTVNGTVNVQSVSVGAESVFYNASTKYDSKSSTTIASLADFNAIATDKTALQPGGTATFANYTSYSLGLNGILVDFVDLAPGSTFSAGDFTFKVGNSNTPSTWATAAAPVSVTAITGPNGDTYADLIWANNAIQNEYLQVTILADTDTGLATPVTFYYGNAIGETGNSTTDAVVNATDVSLAQSHQSGFTVAAITNVYDFNRDGTVNATDVSIAQSHQSGFTPLKLITVPGTSPALSASPAAQVAGVAQPVAAVVPNAPAIPAVGGVAVPVAAAAAPLAPAKLAANPPAPFARVAKPVKPLATSDAPASPLVSPAVVPAVASVVTPSFTSGGASIHRVSFKAPAGLRSLANSVQVQPATVVPPTPVALPSSSPFSQVQISAIYQQLTAADKTSLLDPDPEILD